MDSSRCSSRKLLCSYLFFQDNCWRGHQPLVSWQLGGATCTAWPDCEHSVRGGSLAPLGVPRWRRRNSCEVSALLLYNPWLQIKLMPSTQKRDCVCCLAACSRNLNTAFNCDSFASKREVFPLPWDPDLKLAASQQSHRWRCLPASVLSVRGSGP